MGRATVGWCLVALAALVLQAGKGAAAQSNPVRNAAPTPTPDELATNAAWTYAQVWERVDIAALQLALINLKPEEIGSPLWPAPDALPIGGKALDRFAAALIEATLIPQCDFLWDRSPGPAVRLPHLGNLRASGRLMAVLARRSVDAGDARGAVRFLAAGYRIAGHTSMDRVTVASMYAGSIFQAVDAVAAMTLATGALEQSDRDELRAALATLDEADPFRGAASARGEAELLAQWMEGRVAVGALDELVLHIRSSLAGAGRMNIDTDAITPQVATLAAFDATLAESWPALEPIFAHWNDADTEAFRSARRAELLIPVPPEQAQLFYQRWSRDRDAFRARLVGLAAPIPSAPR